MHNKGCIFCEIVHRQAPSHIFWEDDMHIAFLSIFPNTVGATVVIPKKHYSSYAFAQDDAPLAELVIASKKIARILDDTLEDVGRTAMVFEGYGVDHLHAKLFPMHGTGNHSEFKKISSNIDRFFDRYEGYISSHDWRRADDEQLAALAQNLTSASNLKSCSS
ncbi:MULTISPECIES: HIT family protein [Pseudomonas]|nr:HIT family protein [Pseudomonas sp. MH9.3]MEB0105048.1 HIT family protein [Pseudomonas sp. MH9.3]WPX77381.1 HIT family protein [Pseudomonas sp. MH9.3]WQG59769.1 HIT family protein [Pseudomonas sp. RTB3]